LKFKHLENPTVSDAFDLIDEGLRRKATILIFTSCKAIYEGRAISELGFGERIIMIKPDGSFLIHQERKTEPVNWQPPKSRTRVLIKDEKLLLESYRRTPREHLEVEIKKIHFLNYSLIEDYEDLEIAGYEKDLGDMLMKKPHLIEPGFKITNREYSTEHGFIDILGKDLDGNLVVVELKARVIGVNAVRQIRRYLSDFEDKNNTKLTDLIEDLGVKKKKIRGILVAPKIDEDAKELIEEEGIEFKSIEPPRHFKRDKVVTLDSF
jgi:RecB family endonuclease NucS